MSDYGISQNQPIQRYNYPVVGKKKENKQENMQKAVTYTLATFASLAVATLVGYGIVNKGGSAKKVVDGAKKGAREVARNIKPVNPAREDSSVILKTLAKINSGKLVTLKDLEDAQKTLAFMEQRCTNEKFKIVFSGYSLLFQAIINIYKDNGVNPFKVEIDKVKDVQAPLDNFSEAILVEAIAQSKLSTYLSGISVKLANIKQDGTSLKNTSNGFSINLTDTDKCTKKPDNIISVCESENLKIYAKKDYTNFDDDTVLYIKQDNQYYTFKAAQLKNIAEVTEIENTKIIQDANIKSFANDVKILQCKINGETEIAQYIFGAQNVSNASKYYIKVSDLSEAHLGQLFNKSLVAIDESMALNLAGESLMDALNERIDKAKDDKKVEIITSALSGIEDDKFGDKSVGKAVVNSFIANRNVTEAVLGAVLSKKPDKFVNGDNGSLTNAGVALMAALNEKIDKAEDDKKVEIITSALSGIEDDKFGDKSVGKAVVNSFIANRNVTEAVLGAVLSKKPDKFVNGDNGSLTNAGVALMAALNEKIDKAGNDKKAEIITSALNQIDATKFGDNSVGKAVVTSLMNYDKIVSEVFVSVFNNVEEGRLIKKDKELTKAGKALLDNMIGKGLSLDDINKVVGGKIKNYQNDDKGIKTDENGDFQVKKAKYTHEYLTKKQKQHDGISSNEKLTLLSLLEQNVEKYFEDDSTLKTLPAYNENDFNDAAKDYTKYDANVDIKEDAIRVIKSGSTEFISIIPMALAPDTLGEVLNSSTLVQTGPPNTLTNAGKALIKAIVTNIKDANDIATMLNGINDGKFDSGEIGQFVVDEIVANTDFSTLGKVLVNDTLKAKLVDTSATSNQLTGVGSALIEAIKMRINDESNFNVKAGYISNMLEVIDDGKFASDEIGQFVVDAIVANTDFSTLGEVLNNLKDKLIDTSATDDNKKLKPLGQVLLKGYANQTLSTMHRKISYSRPDGSTERNRIKTEITINGVRFKFYNKDNEIKYYVGQTR